MTIVIKTQNSWNDISKLVFNPIKIDTESHGSKGTLVIAITELGREQVGLYDSTARANEVLAEILANISCCSDQQVCIFEMPKE